MTPARSLKLVASKPVDITLAIRAEIEARDWSAVHIQGDRNKPLGFFRKVIRTWR